jgi:aspartyl-tRNA(Asn)/glutamyl-tRNA(Gln) amidotransferase subunit C
MLSLDQVKHIAKLARIGIDDAEAEKFSKQLSGILEYVELLNEVKTDGVEPTSQVTGLNNVTRKDEVARFSNKEELLACTELPVEEGMISVKQAITHEA